MLNTKYDERMMSHCYDNKPQKFSKSVPGEKKKIPRGRKKVAPLCPGEKFPPMPGKKKFPRERKKFPPHARGKNFPPYARGKKKKPGDSGGQPQPWGEIIIPGQWIRHST
jgi:hypothetical protein